jgi:putative FmdB family regulatory protein
MYSLSMPTYEYACTACANEWEEIQKISADPLDTCPKCGQKTAKRQISGGNFILKGGGWYADLYSSSSNKKTEKGEKGDKSEKSGAEAKGDAAGSASKSDAKSESATTKKPDAKPQAAPSTSSTSGSGSSTPSKT